MLSLKETLGTPVPWTGVGIFGADGVSDREWLAPAGRWRLSASGRGPQTGEAEAELLAT